MCDVEKLILTAPDVAICCQQNEYHSDASHVSGDSAWSSQEVNIVGREQASGVHTTRPLANHAQIPDVESEVTYAVCTVMSSIVVYPHHRCNTLMLSYDRPAIGDSGVFLSAKNMARHMLHKDVL